MDLKQSQEKMEAQLREWGAKLKEWKDKAAKAGTEAQAEMNKKLDDLKPKMEAAQQKLKELRAASGLTAEKLKENADKAMADAKKAWEALKSKFG